MFLIILVLLTPTPILSDCGGYFNSTYGIIQTPNFPQPFHVPIHCRWIIDAFNVANPSIEIFLTQVYAFTGLTFYGYAHYDSSLKFGEELVHKVTEQNFTQVKQIRSTNPFMVIEFRLDRLEGNHLRVLDNLLDVYGFNITYAINTPDSAGNPVRVDSCTIATCSFTGSCFATHDYR